MAVHAAGEPHFSPDNIALSFHKKYIPIWYLIQAESRWMKIPALGNLDIIMYFLEVTLGSFFPICTT